MKLPVRTRSFATAGAIIALTGEQRRVLPPGRPGESAMFQFPAECEPALQAFLKAKLVAERLAEEAKQS